MLSNHFLYYIFIFVIFITTYQNAFTQSSSNNENLKQNWQLYHNQGDYDKAIEQAKLIRQLSKNTNNNELMAQSLHWEGQSLLKKQSEYLPIEEMRKNYLKRV